MNYLPYRCKVCGKDGVATYDAAGFEDARVQWMAALLTHNKCADYMKVKTDQSRRISYALDWSELHQRTAKNQDEADRAKFKTWEVLVDASKKYCFAVCAFYKKPAAWEPFIVDAILASPTKFKTVLWVFENARKQ